MWVSAHLPPRSPGLFLSCCRQLSLLPLVRARDPRPTLAHQLLRSKADGLHPGLSSVAIVVFGINLQSTSTMSSLVAIEKSLYKALLQR